MASSTGELTKLDYTEIVNVVVGVGDAQKRFPLHKHVICHRSPFFRAALTGLFTESKLKEITLPEVDPTVFGIWVQWAYSGQVVLAAEEELQSATDFDNRVLLTSGLYQLADALLDTPLRNAVMDMVLKDDAVPLTAGVVRKVYSSTRANRKLRRYVIDWHVHDCDGSRLEELRRNVPLEFLADLAVEWGRGELTEDNVAKCKYHDHDEEAPACAKGGGRSKVG